MDKSSKELQKSPQEEMFRELAVIKSLIDAKERLQHALEKRTHVKQNEEEAQQIQRETAMLKEIYESVVAVVQGGEASEEAQASLDQKMNAFMASLQKR